MIRMLSIFMLGSLLASCNYLGGESGMFRDRVGDYAEAPVLPVMVIPEDLDSYTLDQLYVIPLQVSVTDTAFEEIPLPKPIETRRQEGVIIQNLGDRRWIVIDATPSQVWPLVRDFWTQLQVILDYENPGTGIMETSWVEESSDLEKRNKYRLLIEPGLHSGYAEIYVIHLENLRSDPVPVIVNWPESSSSPDQEQEVLTNLSQYLADRNDVYQASSASLLAGSIEAERKANIVESEQGDQVLTLRIDYNRAWVQVRQALVEADITILESDRDLQFLNVRFAGIRENDDETGFIGRLFGGGDEEGLSQERDISIRLVQSGDTIDVVTEMLESELSESDEDFSQLFSELLQVISENIG